MERGENGRERCFLALQFPLFSPIESSHVGISETWPNLLCCATFSRLRQKYGPTCAGATEHESCLRSTTGRNSLTKKKLKEMALLIRYRASQVKAGASQAGSHSSIRALTTHCYFGHFSFSLSFYRSNPNSFSFSLSLSNSLSSLCFDIALNITTS